MMDNNDNKSVVKEKEHVLEKQIGGCMAGFFNIFDRPNLISPKRLSSSPTPDSDSASERSSPLKSRESVYSTPELRSPAPRSPLVLPALMAESSSRSSPWRFSKEAPRLSLDSRAVVDAKGSLKPRQIRAEAEAENHRDSPSVIARLMGLEPLPQQPLQRSASESRASSRFFGSFNFQDEKGPEDPVPITIARAQPARAPPLAVRRKSFFDSGDFFPEPRHCGGLIHGGDSDRVSKISGFEAPPTDLETLKQLLEALRLKGLLHSSSNKHQTPIGNGNRNLVFDNYHEPPIKPAARSPSGIRSRPGTRAAGVSPPASPRRDQGSKGSVKRPRRPTLKDQRRVSPLPWQRPQPVHTRIEDERSRSPAEEEVYKKSRTILLSSIQKC